MRVLFVYPNFETCLRIPLALAILAAVVKQKGHEAKVFDPTFLSNRYGEDYRLMESRHVVKKTRLEELIGEVEEKDVFAELIATVKDFKPDLVAISVIERNYSMYKLLGETIRREFPGLPILTGGILATIHPDLLLDDGIADWICVGEGETLMSRLVDVWPDRGAVQRLPNLWYRDQNGVHRNPLGPLEDIEAIPDQSWSEFDPRHLLKPFEGEVYRGGSFEWSRGCLKRCAFCVGPALRDAYGASGPAYHRSKSPAKIIGEIVRKKERYGLTFNAFCDTNFLQAIPVDHLREFCAAYEAEVALPFIIQTSAESITEEKLVLLMKAGCVSASIGVESGSDHIRKNIIRKGPTKARIKECFDLCRAHGFRLTANYIIGLPYETEENVMETIRFNRELNPPSIAIHYFTPFLGTALYDMCMKAGFSKGFDPTASAYRASPLQMPQLSPHRIEEMVQLFSEDFNSWKQEIALHIDRKFAL